LVTIERKGEIVEEAKLATRAVSVKHGQEVVLRGPYEVDIGEIANLLLYLARQLGKEQSRPTPVALAPALQSTLQSNHQDVGTWEGKGGWIHVRLSRFLPPGICTGCSTSTQVWHTANIPTPSFTADSDPLVLRLPLCQVCQAAGNRKRLKKMLWAIGFAILILPLLCILIIVQGAAGARNELMVPCLIIAVVIAASIDVWLFSAAQRSRLPFEISNYSPRDGTIRLRFRNREYAKALLAGVHNGVAKVAEAEAAAARA
jgi:hypothetical protein